MRLLAQLLNDPTMRLDNGSYSWERIAAAMRAAGVQRDANSVRNHYYRHVKGRARAAAGEEPLHRLRPAPGGARVHRWPPSAVRARQRWRNVLTLVGIIAFLRRIAAEPGGSTAARAFESRQRAARARGGRGGESLPVAHPVDTGRRRRVPVVTCSSCGSGGGRGGGGGARTGTGAGTRARTRAARRRPRPRPSVVRTGTCAGARAQARARRRRARALAASAGQRRAGGGGGGILRHRLDCPKCKKKLEVHLQARAAAQIVRRAAR